MPVSRERGGSPFPPGLGMCEVGSSGCVEINSPPLSLIPAGFPSPPRPASAGKLSLLYEPIKASLSSEIEPLVLLKKNKRAGLFFLSFSFFEGL